MDSDPNAHPWCQQDSLLGGMPLLASCPTPPDDTPASLLRLGRKAALAMGSAGALTVGDMRALKTDAVLDHRGAGIRDLIGLRMSVASLADRLSKWPGTRRPAAPDGKGRLRIMLLERGRWTAAFCPNLTSARRRWDACGATLGLVCLSDEIPASVTPGLLSCGRLLASRTAAGSEERAAEWRTADGTEAWLLIEVDGLRRFEAKVAPEPEPALPEQVAPAAPRRLTDRLPLATVGITGPALRALKRIGRTRIGDVRTMRRSQLMALPGVGHGMATRILASTKSMHLPAAGPVAIAPEPIPAPETVIKPKPRPKRAARPALVRLAVAEPDPRQQTLKESVPSEDGVHMQRLAIPHEPEPDTTVEAPLVPEVAAVPPSPAPVSAEEVVQPMSEAEAPVAVEVPEVPAPTTPLLDMIQDNLSHLTPDQADAVSRRFGLSGPVQGIDVISASTGISSDQVDASIRAGLLAIDGATGAITQLSGHAAFLRTLAPIPLDDVLSEPWTMGMPTEMVSEMLTGMAGLTLVGDGADARFEAVPG